MPRAHWLAFLAVVVGVGVLWGSVAGWLVTRARDEGKLRETHLAMNQYIHAAAVYAMQAQVAQGELSYLRQVPECAAR